MTSPQFWSILCLLGGTAALINVRGDQDRVPSSTPLSQFPSRIGVWSSTDVPIHQDVLDVLGKGFFLNRIYTETASVSPATVSPATTAGADSIGLFIGYFPTQRTGQSIHSPQNCLPGSGWTFESSGTTDITDDVGKMIRVGEYVISDGTSKDEVLYWYRAHGRSMASDYAAKFYTLLDSIRYSRTDAALVRVVTTMRPGESRQAAHDRAVNFVKETSPLLPAYVPD